jgi:adenine-specific DNA methylase
VLRKENGRLVFTYHHWNPEGWAAITVGLKRAGFVLVNRYVVHSENPISVHIAGFKALTDDAILVLAPVEAGIEAEWERPERIDMAESARFCRDCGTLLGWLLGSGLGEEEIYGEWRGMLGVG